MVVSSGRLPVDACLDQILEAADVKNVCVARLLEGHAQHGGTATGCAMPENGPILLESCIVALTVWVGLKLQHPREMDAA
jgi:hypothetical protein